MGKCASWLFSFDNSVEPDQHLVKIYNVHILHLSTGIHNDRNGVGVQGNLNIHHSEMPACTFTQGQAHLLNAY